MHGELSVGDFSEKHITDACASVISKKKHDLGLFDT